MVDDDLIGDAYEYLMRNFASQSGKSKGQFYTPAEVSRVMAKEVLEEEKKQNQPVDKRQKAKAALTELFESIRSKDTPIAVEAVVNDIDTQVVAIVRKFTDTFATLAGQNEVKRQLRSILWIKYKIKDNEVFEKAYKYIEMYY